ncbi:MAG TPA: hypothetical protein VNJ01_17510 [Bacteriovoracaceae bacterium]|nr:hypothetical protein [Bacteriovoracaceae bacterium]
MTKILVTLAFLIGVFSSDFSQAAVPTEAFTFDTNVRPISMTSSQEDKLDKAADLIKRVIATEAFRNKVLNHTYGGKKTFKDNGGLTNLQIYNKILAGAEKLQPSRDNEMDIEVELYYESANVVGYTMTGSKRIYMNTKFFNSYTSVNVSGNMMHEWLHKLGFKHAVNYTYSRDFSIPYAIGNIVESLARNV